MNTLSAERVTDCHWCGRQCRLTKKGQRAYCQSKERKCLHDHHASRKSSWSTLDGLAMLIDQGFECAGCSRYLPTDLYDQDHVSARAVGGGDKLGNIQMLCVSCNRSKGKKAMDSFMDTGLRWIGGGSLSYEQAVDSFLFYCEHKRVRDRARALLDDRIPSHSKTEKWSAQRILEWLDEHQSVIQ